VAFDRITFFERHEADIVDELYPVDFLDDLPLIPPSDTYTALTSEIDKGIR
jgi:hypothetical protein